MKKKRVKTITVTVEGGTVQGITGIPEGVRVRVMDFDTDGVEEERLSKNKAGEEYLETIYTRT